MKPRLILGSSSERRRKILRALGVVFESVTPMISELPSDGAPQQIAVENARRKNLWCQGRFPTDCILTADTTIAFDGRCMGKPHTWEEARKFLAMFSNRTHTVLTAVAFGVPGWPTTVCVAESSVTFLPLDDTSIRDYLCRVNPFDKAGAYDMDQLGERIIRAFTGSRTNIMGLPVHLVVPWLRTHGFLPCEDATTPCQYADGIRE